jgi:hypothetical protein
MTKLPSNIQEFNIIAGLVFAQLYKAFPVRVDLLDRGAIAESMGVEGKDWGAHMLPSGRSFSEVLASTLAWLAVEDFIHASGAHCAEHLTLTEKGLAAMKAVPSGLRHSVGAELAEKAEKGWRSDYGAMGDLVGGIIGGVTKSLTS